MLANYWDKHGGMTFTWQQSGIASKAIGMKRPILGY